MAAGAVAHVGLPAVAGKLLRKRHHHPVARDLGDDRGGGDREREPVAADHRRGTGRAGPAAAGGRRPAPAPGGGARAATARRMARKLACRMFIASISATLGRRRCRSRRAAWSAARELLAARGRSGACCRRGRRGSRRDRGSPPRRPPARPRGRGPTSSMPQTGGGAALSRLKSGAGMSACCIRSSH